MPIKTARRIVMDDKGEGRKYAVLLSEHGNNLFYDIYGIDKLSKSSEQIALELQAVIDDLRKVVVSKAS